MTRFNISLDEGKYGELGGENGLGGDIFVPKIPSYKLLDLARAINSKNKLEIIGIRKGEKIHEEMITVADSQTTYEIDKYYVILPDNTKQTLKRFKRKFGKMKKVDLNFNYNSEKKKIFKSFGFKRMIKKFI